MDEPFGRPRGRRFPDGSYSCTPWLNLEIQMLPLGATSAPQLSPVSVSGNFGNPFAEFSSSPDGRKAFTGLCSAHWYMRPWVAVPELSTTVSPKPLVAIPLSTVFGAKALNGCATPAESNL